MGSVQKKTARSRAAGGGPATASYPGTLSPESVWLGVRLLARAQTMGLATADAAEISFQSLHSLISALAKRGVATEAAARLHRQEGDLEGILRQALGSVDASPQPEGEWQPVRTLLGDSLLAALVGGISPASVRRYAEGTRQTPDGVAWRLHAVARILSGIMGSYNAYGARRWFERPRHALDDTTPLQVFQSALNEDDPSLQTLFGLAESLLGPGGGG